MTPTATVACRSSSISPVVSSASRISPRAERTVSMWGVGGMVAPFVGIKLIDLLVTAMGVS